MVELRGGHGDQPLAEAVEIGVDVGVIDDGIFAPDLSRCLAAHLHVLLNRVAVLRRLDPGLGREAEARGQQQPWQEQTKRAGGHAHECLCVFILNATPCEGEPWRRDRARTSVRQAVVCAASVSEVMW